MYKTAYKEIVLIYKTANKYLIHVLMYKTANKYIVLMYKTTNKYTY